MYKDRVWVWVTVGNQADIIESSLCQSLNIEMNTSMVGLSYLKITSSETNSNVEKIHYKKMSSYIGDFKDITSIIKLSKCFRMENYRKKTTGP